MCKTLSLGIANFVLEPAALNRQATMLYLQDVKKSYTEPDGSALPILDIPKFHLAVGEQAAMLGRSGCGKTTLLHVIAGISRPDSGVVRVAGRDITTLSEVGCDRWRAEKIGYVFQTFNLLSGFSALENVMLGMAFARIAQAEKRARDLLDHVGLSHRLQHKPAALSVGEQQRVAVARALAKHPKLLLADEPTANVDPANQQHIVDLIRDTCREREVTLLMVTHAREIAEQFEKVVRLEDVNQVSEQTTAS